VKYIGFIQSDPSPQKNINKLNELQTFLTNERFMQQCNQWYASDTTLSGSTAEAFA
jgi:hypothetical protein